MHAARRILVIEDEHILAENVQSFLARRAPDVRIANSGLRAVEMIETFAPDVIVLDYGLPGANGLQIYRELLRRSAGPVPCVMITGYPSETIAPPANRLGIRHVLCKPFSLVDLQRLIDLSTAEP